MTKRIPNSLMIAAGTLALMSVSTSVHALPSCQDQGLSYWEQNVNVTADWQTTLLQGLSAGLSIATINTNFQNEKCEVYYNQATPIHITLRHGAIIQKACSVRKPDAVINGTSIDHGGNTSTNPATMRQSGCYKKIEPQKLQPFAKKRALSLNPGPFTPDETD